MAQGHDKSSERPEIRRVLRVYAALSRPPFPKSYLGKVFLTAFVDTHVPLLALLIYLVRYRHFGIRGTLRILSVTVPATLAGTTATLWAMHSLSAPVSLASKALRRYIQNGELPELPVGYTDRAGKLMADVQYTVERLDAAMHSLEELASKDTLTGLYNRRSGEEHLAEDVARAERRSGTFTLAMVDLDQFKLVNDRYGHRAGDACLIRFAEALGGNVRAGDWAARWGGDELVVGMWSADDEDAPVERVLERVARDLRENPVVLPSGDEARLTFSAGVCRWRKGDEMQELFSRVDEALYRAKVKGGNIILHAD